LIMSCGKMYHVYHKLRAEVETTS